MRVVGFEKSGKFYSVHNGIVGQRGVKVRPMTSLPI